MTRRVFAIVLNEPSSGFWDNLRKQFPDSYQYSPTFFLVRPLHPMLTKNVAAQAGIKTSQTDSRPSGVVYKLNAGYWGFASTGLWEWLADSDE